MKNEIKVTLIQAPLVWENPEANRVYFSAEIKKLKSETNLIVLPEMFTTGFTMNASALAETMDGKTVTWMKELAFKCNSAITGSLIFTENGKFYNRLLFVTPEGEIFHYDKRHLFTLANEHEHFSPGTEKVVIEYKGWKICPLICYDLRFPVWSRNVENYDLLIYVANWPEQRIQSWDILLHARAIENMAYCIGVNRVGMDKNEISYVGHSVVFDALGKNLTPLNLKEEAIIQTTLNKTNLQKIRAKFKFLNDRDSYKLT